MCIRYNVCMRKEDVFFHAWGWCMFVNCFISLSLPESEFELDARATESSATKSRWARRGLKMHFAFLVILKDFSCHSYSEHWQRRIAPWQIVLATGPYRHWTLKLAWGWNLFLSRSLGVESTPVKFSSCRFELHTMKWDFHAGLAFSMWIDS